MKILAPTVRVESGSVIVSTQFQSETGEDTLWFKLDAKYQDCVVTERADAFLVGLLLYAMVRGEDIHLDCPVSEKLYYNLSNYLIPALTLANPKFQRIEIVPTKLEHHSLNKEGAVGTGFSGGVDSFCTIHDHFANPKCPENYRLTHLTFFNVGSHGDYGGEAARVLFNERLNLLKTFPHESGLDLVVVDSNISDVLQLNYEETFTLRCIAPVLLLQKFFCKYYFSAGYRFDEFRLVAYDMALYDALTAGMLSTESTSIYSAGSQYTRVEKTMVIADYEPTWRYLNVCACRGANCSSCFKCLRTLYTLDLLGKIKNYKGIFNLGEYARFKGRYIGQVLANKTDCFYRDIFKEMTSQAVQVSVTSRLFALKYSCASSWRKIAKKFRV